MYKKKMPTLHAELSEEILNRDPALRSYMLARRARLAKLNEGTKH